MTEQQRISGGAWAIGLASIAAEGRVLDTLYLAPRVGLDGAPAGAAPGTRPRGFAGAPALGGGPFAGAARADELRGVTVAAVLTVVDDLQAPPADVHDAYLRLHLLSHRLPQPHNIKPGRL